MPLSGGSGSNGSSFYKNDIINGQFRIAQAGTSFATATSGAYDLDGWLNSKSSTAVYTIARVAGENTGTFARQSTITTADAAVAVGDYVQDRTRIEGINIVKYIGNTFTIGFRAKVPVAGIHCVSLRSSGANYSYVHEINFPVANAWQDCSFTVAGGLTTSGTWDYLFGSVGLDVLFTHMCGSTFQTASVDQWVSGNFYATANQVNDCDTIGNVWSIQNVTLNLGTKVLKDTIGYEDELRRCQRYYYPILLNVPVLATPENIPISMRATPTITGGGAGFDSTGTTKDTLFCAQTAMANQTLLLSSRL